MTRWKPDTCSCVLDVIEWDTDQATTVKTCDQHAGLMDNAHMAVVYHGECFVKNMALGDVALAVPRLVSRDDGLSAEVRWRFLSSPVGQARQVEITAPQLTTQERTAITTRLQARNVRLR